jgi:DNA sulfur modification protein DndB
MELISRWPLVLYSRARPLGGLGATLISLYTDNWESKLKPLERINWERTNPDWQDKVIANGTVTNNRNSRAFMTAYLKRKIGLPQTPEEERL